MKYLILLLASLFFSCCSDEQIINSILSPIDIATIGVKSKTFYPSLELNQIISIEEFEYNYKGLLQKKVYYGGNREIVYHYELFNYGANEKLIYKLNYHNNINSPTGFILLDSTIYLYSRNLLATEVTTYPYANYFEKYNYEYNGQYPVKKTKYHNEELETYITYEYKDGKLTREISYNKDNAIIETKENKYIEAALVESIYYTFRNEAKRKINYSYNKNGKLVLEKVDELFIYSSLLPYIIRYQY